MRNTNSKVRCEKRRFSKCKEVVKTYTDLQYAFADMLEKDATIKEFVCNYPLSDFPITDGKYTTDFYCTTISGEILDGTETLSITSLNKAYHQRLALLHNHINIREVKHSSVKQKHISVQPLTEMDGENPITDAIVEVKKNGGDFMALIRGKIKVIEVQI